MCHQATWTIWFMITLIAFLWLIYTMWFHTYVSSEHLAVSTQIYIGCIFLVYLHCVASSVSLNGQLEKMHSCTGCNWKVFRHYAFSNVGSKHFDKCMHSHTGHICMAFPLCFIKCILKCQLVVFYLWEFVNGKSRDFQNNILFTHLYLSISVYVHCAFSDLFSELYWNHSCCTQMAFA